MSADEGQRGKNRRLLHEVLRDGVQTHMWAVQNIGSRTKTFLAVGAIVAGILIAGLGNSIGVIASAPGGPELLRALPVCLLVFLAACGIASISSILLSMYYSVRALKNMHITVTGLAPFSSDGKTLDWELLERWVDLPEDEIYKHVHNYYIGAAERLKRNGAEIAADSHRGRLFLMIGLAAGATLAIATIITAVVLVAPLAS